LFYLRLDNATKENEKLKKELANDTKSYEENQQSFDLKKKNFDKVEVNQNKSIFF
jgi:hypothetical protein